MSNFFSVQGSSRMSKIKMRCNTCGKWFQSANAKEVTCPDCLQKARKEKLAAKNAPPTPAKGAATPNTQPRVVAPAPKPKPVQSGTNQWLDSLQDVKVAEPEPPKPKIPSPPPPREQHQHTLDNPRAQSAPPADTREDYSPRRENFPRGPAPYDEGRRAPNNYRPGGPGPGNYRPSGPGQNDRPNGYRPGGPGPGNYRPAGTDQPGIPAGPRPRQPIDGRNPRGPRPEGGHEHGPAKPKPRPKGHGPKPSAPPKPKREKIPPPEPFTPTEEQIKLVENRYVELATPAEFDGIRTKIAEELSIPKKAVKTIIKEFRDKQHIPSWWEVQTYKGSSEELEKIKTAYLPYLPVPEVGVHKKIAETLDMKPGIIYQAIKSIRLEMNLPQYNDPSFHEEELAAIRELHAQNRKAAEEAQNQEAQNQEAQNQETQNHEIQNQEPSTETSQNTEILAEGEASPEHKVEVEEKKDAQQELID
jgi:hypothetical protein